LTTPPQRYDRNARATPVRLTIFSLTRLHHMRGKNKGKGSQRAPRNLKGAEGITNRHGTRAKSKTADGQISVEDCTETAISRQGLSDSSAE